MSEHRTVRDKKKARKAARELEAVLVQFVRTNDVSVLVDAEKLINNCLQTDRNSQLDINGGIMYEFAFTASNVKHIFQSNVWLCLKYLLSASFVSKDEVVVLLEGTRARYFDSPIMAQIDQVFRSQMVTERHGWNALSLMVEILEHKQCDDVLHHGNETLFRQILAFYEENYFSDDESQRLIIDRLTNELGGYPKTMQSVRGEAFLRAGGLHLVFRLARKAIQAWTSGASFNTTILRTLAYLRAFCNSSCRFSESEAVDPSLYTLNDELWTELVGFTEKLLDDSVVTTVEERNFIAEEIEYLFSGYISRKLPSQLRITLLFGEPTREGYDGNTWYLRWVKALTRVKRPDLQHQAITTALDWCDLYPASDAALKSFLAKEREERKHLIVRKCAYGPCEVSTETVFTQLRKCERCRAVYYCGTLCQRAHWYDHRRQCRRPRSEAEETGLQPEDLTALPQNDDLRSPS